MEMKARLLNLCFYSFLFEFLFQWVDGNCILNLSNDLAAKNQPLLLERKHGHIDFLLPKSGGNIVLRNGEDVLLACPGNKNYLQELKISEDHGLCVPPASFRVSGKIYEGKSLMCNARAQASLKITSTCARGKGAVIQLGFKLPESGQFIKLVEVCHNISRSETYFSRHTIHGALLKNKIIESGRPEFAKGDNSLYKGIDMRATYSKGNQKTVISSLVGSDSNIKVDSVNFLSRGHLAPDADFIFSSHQFLTYFYVNTAPQWQPINAGVWRKVEGATRKTAMQLGYDLDVVTGTFGVLMSETGIPIFLEGSRLPVPEFFWKVLHDPRDGSCIVFVTINDPFISCGSKQPICPDVCRINGWTVQDRPNCGYSYCCTYKDFAKVVRDHPAISCNNVTLRSEKKRPRSEVMYYM